MKEYDIWMDIETTGIDETKGTILQVAYILTEKGNPEEIASTEIDLIDNWKNIAPCDYESGAHKLHVESGLFEKFSKIALLSYPERVAKNIKYDNPTLSLFLRDIGVDYNEDVFRPCGWNVGFDIRWLYYQGYIGDSLDMVYGKYRRNNRYLDVQCIYSMLNDTGFKYNKPVMQHTALADLKATKDWYYTVVEDLAKYIR